MPEVHSGGRIETCWERWNMTVQPRPPRLEAILNSRNLDWTIGLLTCVMILWPLGGILSLRFASRDVHSKVEDVMRGAFPVIPVGIGLVYGVALLMWLVKGDGASSRLWKWLPPFVCFHDWGRTMHAVIIVIMVSGSLVGAVVCLIKYIFFGWRL